MGLYTHLYIDPEVPTTLFCPNCREEMEQIQNAKNDHCWTCDCGVTEVWDD